MAEVARSLRSLESIQGYLTAWPREFFITQAIFKDTSQHMAKVASILHNPDNIQELFTAWLRLWVFYTTQTIFKDTSKPGSGCEFSTQTRQYSRILHSLTKGASILLSRDNVQGCIAWSEFKDTSQPAWPILKDLPQRGQGFKIPYPWHGLRVFASWSSFKRFLQRHDILPRLSGRFSVPL
jgi:hypothetical protein